MVARDGCLRRLVASREVPPMVVHAKVETAYTIGVRTHKNAHGTKISIISITVYPQSLVIDQRMLAINSYVLAPEVTYDGWVLVSITDINAPTHEVACGIMMLVVNTTHPVLRNAHHPKGFQVANVQVAVSAQGRGCASER